MPVPNLGIRSNPIVNFRVLEMIGAGARAMSAALQERKRVELQRQQMQQEAAQFAATQAMKTKELDLREKTMQMESDLKKQREERLAEQGERRIAASEQRGANQTLELRRKILRDLDPQRQAEIKGGVLGLAREQLKTPLVDADGNTERFQRFQDRTVFDLADDRRRAENKLAEWQADEFAQFNSPGRGDILEKDLQEITEAHAIRNEEFQELLQLRGSQFGFSTPAEISQGQAALLDFANTGDFSALNAPDVNLESAATKGPATAPAGAETPTAEPVPDAPRDNEDFALKLMETKGEVAAGLRRSFSRLDNSAKLEITKIIAARLGSTRRAIDFLKGAP